MTELYQAAVSRLESQWTRNGLLSAIGPAMKRKRHHPIQQEKQRLKEADIMMLQEQHLSPEVFNFGRAPVCEP